MVGQKEWGGIIVGRRIVVGRGTVVGRLSTTTVKVFDLSRYWFHSEVLQRQFCYLYDYQCPGLPSLPPTLDPLSRRV